MKQILQIIAVIISATFFAVADTILICKSCSWELAAEAKFCSHCGADVKQGARPPAAGQTPPSKEISPAPPPAPPPVSPATAAILRDIAWAKEFHADNSAAALAALGNAGAIVSVSPADAVSENDRRFIFDGIKTLRKNLTLSSPAPCAVCKGTGKMESATEIRTLVGTSPLAVPRKKETCEFCKGSGTIHRYQVQNIKAQVTAGEREYARIAQIDGRKLFPRSTIYMPENLSASFTKEQTNAISRAVTAVCAACAGFGLEACAACTGVGIIKCPEKNCVNGLITPPAAARTNVSGTGRNVNAQPIDSTPQPKRCDVCNGVSFIRCPTCSGMSTLPCRRCAAR